MASSRAITSALTSAAARPTAWRAAARPCAAVLCAAPRAFTTATTRVTAQTTTATKIASRGTVAVSTRWFSAKNEEDLVPGSKRWEFDDITRQLDSGDENVVFVDVREPVELRETGKIPGAINIPITSAVQSFHVPEEDFEDVYGFARPDKDKTLVFYCKAGVRAKTAAGLAKHAGWSSVGEYTGSWIDWAEKKGPVERVKGGN